MVGDELYETNVALVNTGATAADIVLYRAGDCYLQNSDFGFGILDDPSFGSVGCVAANTDGNGIHTKGSRLEEWIPLDGASNHIEGFYDNVWAAVGTRAPFPNTDQQDEYIDNGAGLSWSFQLAAGGQETHGNLIRISPILATLDRCASEELADSIPAGTGRVTVTYDARHLVPQSEPGFQAKAAAIATAIKNRAEATLGEYAALGFGLSANITIEIRCQIRALDLIPFDTTGFTEAADKIKLRADFIAHEFANGSTGPNAPWHSLVDHELLHTIQLQALFGAQLTSTLKYTLGGDETNIESTAQLGPGPDRGCGRRNSRTTVLPVARQRADAPPCLARHR